MLILLILSAVVNIAYLLGISLGWLTANDISLKKYVAVSLPYVINLILIGVFIHEYLR